MAKVRFAQSGVPTELPPVGFTWMFVDTTDNHLKTIDSDGLVIDLTLVNNPDNSDAILFAPQSPAPAYEEGLFFYDDDEHTHASYTDIDGYILHNGIDNIIRVINKTGVPIAKGKAIRNGGIDVTSGRIKAVMAKADALATAFVIGLTVEEIPVDGESIVVSGGHVPNIDTSLLSLATIFLSDTAAGEVVHTPPDIASALGTVQEVGASGAFFVKIDNLITYPPSHGYMRGQNTPLYTLLTGVKQDVADFIEIETIILTGNKLTGELTGSLGGSYTIDFTAVATFPSLTSTRTIFFEVYNVTQDVIEGAFPKNIPRDATTDGVSFTAPVQLLAADTYKIRVYADVDINLTLTNCAFMLTSRHLG